MICRASVRCLKATAMNQHRHLACGSEELSAHVLPFADLPGAAVFGGVGERGDDVVEGARVCVV